MVENSRFVENKEDGKGTIFYDLKINQFAL